MCKFIANNGVNVEDKSHAISIVGREVEPKTFSTVVELIEVQDISYHEVL